MAEAHPDTGAEPVTDTDSAVAHVAGLLEPEGPTENADNEPEQVPQGEPAEKPADEETSSEETDDAEPAGESEELPDTLESFAEALGMEPDELAGHLKIPLKIDGNVSHVPLAEAMKGARLEADYTRKTMELAEQRKQVEAQATEASERWQQQVQALQTAIQTLEGEAEAGPSAEQLAQLMEDDPQEYLRVMARQNARKERLDAATKLRDEEIAKAREEASQKFVKFRTEQQRVLSEKMPEVSDPKKLAAFEDGSQTYLEGLGYSVEEIGGFFSGPFDHRQILIIRDAMRFRALQEGQKTLPKKLQNLAKVQKPGAATRGKSDTDKLAASSNRLRQLKTKGTRAQQNKAAVDRVKMIL